MIWIEISRNSFQVKYFRERSEKAVFQSAKKIILKVFDQSERMIKMEHVL